MLDPGGGQGWLLPVAADAALGDGHGHHGTGAGVTGSTTSKDLEIVQKGIPLVKIVRFLF